MLRLIVLAGCVSLGPIAFAAGSAQPPADPQPEAPVAIAEGGGRWVINDGVPAPSLYVGRPSLGYRVPAFPRLSLNLVRFECEFPGGTRVEVTGLIPAQRFPQPGLTLRVGERSWSTTPNALYHPRTAPFRGASLPDSMLDDNLKGRDLSWPGNPAYAALSFFNPPNSGLNAALASGAEVSVAFAGQRRRFPAVPAETASRFARACAQLAPPAYSAR